MTPNRPTTSQGCSPADGVSLTIAAGLAAGYLDRLALELRSLLIDPLVFVGHHAWWTGPVATVLFFAPLALGLAVATRIVRRPDRLWLLWVWVFGFFAAFGALYSFPQVQRVAVLILSVGFATVLARQFGEPSPARRRQVRWLAAGLGVLTAGIAATGLGREALRERRLNGAETSPADTPNVLLLVLDTVRAINLSLYGYHRETTPQLARWATRGVVFTRAYSTAPWTLPSHASMMTGRWMHELSADWMVPLDRADSTLAEFLGRRGYRTGGFVANTDYCSAEVGLDRGFGHYEDYTLDPGQVLRSSSLWRAAARIAPVRRLIGNYDNLGRRTAPEISDAFLDWLDRNPGRPFFGFLNYYDAHRPYFPPGDWPNRFRTPGVDLNPRYRKEDGSDRNPPQALIQGAIDAYDNAIGYLDSEIGKLLEELERRGQLGRTIIIVTSDHGEEFHERGLWDHGNSLYHPSVHVPLIVIAPGLAPAGATVTSPVSLRSLPATIADLLGAATGSPFPGRSLAGTWTSPGSPPDSILLGLRQVPRQPFWYPVSKGDMGSIVTEQTQYIRNLGDQTEEMFGLDRGVTELRKLPVDSSARELGRLRAMVDAMFPNR